MRIAAIACFSVLGALAVSVSAAQQCTLPATGQNLCYGWGGSEPCPVPGFPGQDAEHVYNPMSYLLDTSVPEEPTVRDLVTGLEWTQTRWESMTWQAALQWCADSLNARHYGGHTDWRLPDVKELASISDFGRSSPAIDPVFALESPPLEPRFWSSTTVHQSPDQAWEVAFATGNDIGCAGEYHPCTKTNIAFVRAVRGDATGVPATGQTRCYDNTSEQPCPVAGFPGQDAEHVGNPMSYVEDSSVPVQEVIQDLVTGLEWTKQHWGSMDWQDALQWCADSLNAIAYSGRQAWRLPNAKELQSIVDYGRAYDAMDPIWGPPFGGHYWSGTTWVHVEYGAAWVMSPGDGTIRVLPKVSASAHVRAVRCQTGPTRVQKTTWGAIKSMYR